MDKTEQTRFKYGIIFCALVFIEGLVKHFLTGFPFETAIYLQGAAVGVYTLAKTGNNISYNNSKTESRNAPTDK